MTMGMESFHPDAPPTARKSRNPVENQSEKNMIQAMLMARSPEGEQAWSERYRRVFRELFNDDAFHDLVREAHLETDPGRKGAFLRRIQEALDAELERNPRFDED